MVHINIKISFLLSATCIITRAMYVSTRFISLSAAVWRTSHPVIVSNIFILQVSLCFPFFFFLFSPHSIKHRTVILQRGLADRSALVVKECLRLMKEEWLGKCCNGDVVEFLKFLDVETYELVGDSVIRALLEAGLVQICDDESIQKYISSCSSNTDG